MHAVVRVVGGGRWWEVGGGGRWEVVGGGGGGGDSGCHCRLPLSLSVSVAVACCLESQHVRQARDQDSWDSPVWYDPHILQGLCDVTVLSLWLTQCNLNVGRVSACINLLEIEMLGLTCVVWTTHTSCKASLQNS